MAQASAQAICRTFSSISKLLKSVRRPLSEPDLGQNLLHDDLLDGAKHVPHQVGVGGGGEERVDVPGLAIVVPKKPLHNETPATHKATDFY